MKGVVEWWLWFSLAWSFSFSLNGTFPICIPAATFCASTTTNRGDANSGQLLLVLHLNLLIAIELHQLSFFECDLFDRFVLMSRRHPSFASLQKGCTPIIWSRISHEPRRRVVSWYALFTWMYVLKGVPSWYSITFYLEFYLNWLILHFWRVLKFYLSINIYRRYYI